MLCVQGMCDGEVDEVFMVYHHMDAMLAPNKLGLHSSNIGDDGGQLLTKY